MGAHFGNLYTRLRIITVRLSSYELKAFPDPGKAFEKNSRRIWSLIDCIPGFGFGATLYTVGESYHKSLMRKKPGQFDNEED